MVAPWLWNSTKGVFLSTEDEMSIAAKTSYVAGKGLGGVMIWELAGDYAFDSTKNQYHIGDTLISKINDGLRGAAPYGASKAGRTMPAAVLNVDVSAGSGSPWRRAATADRTPAGCAATSSTSS